MHACFQACFYVSQRPKEGPGGRFIYVFYVCVFFREGGGGSFTTFPAPVISRVLVAFLRDPT